MNNRRKLVVALGAVALSSPLGSLAQRQGKLWRVGFLSFRGRPLALENDFYGGFPRGMRELGYTEGNNLVIEWRFADGSREHLSSLAAELVRMKVDAIVTAGTLATRAAKEATTTIPIVIGAGVDPVASGLVASLARPGANVTGLSNLASDLRPKHLAMLLSVMPNLTRVAILVNPNGSNDAGNLQAFVAAVQQTKVIILPAEARGPQEFENAFAMIVRGQAGAVISTLNPIFVQHGRLIAELATKHRLPSIAPNREYAEAGGLMSYGQNQTDSYRRAATYVDKIIKGTHPSHLPIEQPMTFDLAVNLRTAKLLGLTVPPDIMVQATQVIE